MRVLGIESSCDETGAAVVELEMGATPHLLSNALVSQIDIHKEYGGVVPEIAARSHIEAVIPIVDKAVREASTASDPWSDIDAIAVTYGAGLGGSLLVGTLTARTLAILKKKPLYAINHVEGHVYANFIDSKPPEFPLLALIVSGGHSQLVLFRDHFDYTLLGKTVDDAIGEAFDKVAKILGLPYPGGPSIAKAATLGNPDAYHLPKSKVEGAYNFSFSGLKTATLRLCQELAGKDFTFPSFGLAGLLNASQRHDVAASFQRIAIETVVDKTVAAFNEFSPTSVVIAGGVAANSELRSQLSSRLTIPIEYAPAELCTDNGAMISCLGCYHALLDTNPADPYTLAIEPNLKMKTLQS